MYKPISREQLLRIEKRFKRLYGNEGMHLTPRFLQLLGRYGVGAVGESHERYWDQHDIVLITYADILQAEGEAPLKTLHRFARRHLKTAIRTIHLLPFYPWSSDDGFSVIDYREVAPENGKWEDVLSLHEDFNLMFDLVLNHCSRHSRWFKDFVTGIAPARWYFLPMDPKTDLSEVVRPRPWPLLSKTATRDGPAWVWTTFSEDQVDLNWKNPDVLFEFLDILFLYLSMGCRIFRLDAVAFLWKEIGTSCLHLPETHEVVKLFRDVLDFVSPDALLLTETNVPHDENIRYFGGGDEAHMVYNFSLPPLMLYSFLREDCSPLQRWARQLPPLPSGQAFFNFSASHDGIGVRPLQGLIPASEIRFLEKAVKERGGRVSMKANADGSNSPYELNITYLDALSIPGDEERGVARFLCSQALVLAFRGMPAIYFHSLVGTPNDQEGLAGSGQNRRINRKKYAREELEAALASKEGWQARIFARLTTWMKRRQDHPAFHPDGAMEVLDLGPDLFGFVRTSPLGNERILCLFNFTSRPVERTWKSIFPPFAESVSRRELLSNRLIKTGPRRKVTIPPFYALWVVE